MPTAQRSVTQTEKLFMQMLDLIEEITLTYADREEEEEESEREREALTALTEEAAERGLDEDQVERIFRGILTLARNARES